MRKILLVMCACLGASAQQTVETFPFRAVLSSGNEVPPPGGLNASGAATVWVHVVRDAGGQITSGSVDFNVKYAFPGPVTITAMHIHPGAAGASGPPVISSGLSDAAPVSSADGNGSIGLQGQVAPDDGNGLEALKSLLADPTQFYLNLHTTDNPAGAIRGQLQRADMAVLMGLMSPQNEVPTADINGGAVGSVVALRTPDSGQVIFDVRYAFQDQVNFTGLHIHSGAAGANGPVVIGSGLQGPVQSEADGSGTLHYEAEVNLGNAAAVQALDGLFTNPSQYYINVHTDKFPAGAARAQLRNTDRARFQLNMLPANEVPPVTGLDAGAPAAVTVYVLRIHDGSAPAGVVLFDVNPRFGGPTVFTGLNLHNGRAGESGPATISAVNALGPVRIDTGAGNIFRFVTVANPSGIATLNSLLRNPENHYVNLNTSDYPGGAVRAALAAPITDAPVLGFAMSSVSDPQRTTVAPGGLATLFGKNLTKVAATMAGLQDDSAPQLLNGTEVTIAGRDGGLVTVTPDYAVVQVPVETPSGQQQVVLRSTNGASTYNITVAPFAPAIYFDPVGGILQKNSDFSLIRPDNPAHAGDIVVIWSTGLGQTNPPLATGKLAAVSPLANTQPVSVTIGGQSAEVVYSVAAPGFLGLYQTGVKVPDGLAPGTVPVTLTVGGVTSNTVNIAVQ